MEHIVRHMYNVKLPTVLFCIEFNTVIKLVLLTKYMDLISGCVSDNCGYRMSNRIINVGVNIHMTGLSYNTHHT
jgi:hypothetical protein